MTSFSQQNVSAFFARSDAATTTADKGKALEDCIEYIFSTVPGISLIERNKLNAFGTEETDVAIWNEKERDGLHFLPNVILVECKNWSSHVGTHEVAYFDARLQHRGCDHGILVAVNGTTGNSEDLVGSRFTIATALTQGRKILVITRQELESLTSVAEFILLLKKKILSLTVTGSSLV